MGKHHKRHRIPTTWTAGFAIREKRPGYFIFDAMLDGTRIRKCFSDLKDAEDYARAKRDAIRTKGLNEITLSDRVAGDAVRALGVLKDHHLDAGLVEAITDYAAAVTALQPVGGTLAQAVTEYARRHPATVMETFSETCDRYLSAMETEGRRPASVADKRVKFGKLREGLGDRPTSAIDDGDVKAWVEAQGYGNGTARAYAGAAKSALAFYRGEKRERRATDEKPPTTWSVATVRAIMAAAEKAAPDFVPALGCLFFAGLRPDEVKRLTWDAIDFTEKEIHLDGTITKTRTSRHVRIEDNLLAWLTAYRGDGPLVESAQAYRLHREKVMAAAKVDGWPVDVARHTYATALYRTTGDVAVVMQALGHFGSASTFVRHYKGVPMGGKDAAAYFKIEPKTKSNVVRMKRAAVA